MRRCVKIYKQYCVNRVAESKQQEEQLRKSMEVAVTNLQSDPTNPEWQDRLATSMDGLQRFEKSKKEGQMLRSRITWKMVGDQCSKEFFQATKEKSTTSHITELLDRGEQTHTSQPALQQICKEYYGALYTT
jgi:hypothetical protein